MRRSMFVLWLVALFAAFAVVSPQPTAAESSKLCFAEVPDCIEGRFVEYWRENGGLPVFGFPISAASLQSVGGGNFLVQTFERNRFEYHPENARPYDVLLGRLGDDRLRQLGRPWETQPKATDTSRGGCSYFGETQHLVCDAFLTYWRGHGLNLDGKKGFTTAESLALIGLPLTEATVETGSDGKPYLTQWFERARFELHTEISASTVLLGLLGRETQSGPPAPVCDVPDPVSATLRPGKCVNAGETLSIDIFGFQANEDIGFWLTSPDGQTVGTVQTINIGPSGGVSDLPFTTNDMAPGTWFFVFQGVSSKHQSIIYFKILGQAATPPPAPSDLPANQNASASPSSGPRGTRFSFSGTGFTPNEQVGVYITAPDQSVLGAPFQVTADGQGVAGGVSYASASNDAAGVYAVTFEGVTSKHKAIAYFRITP